MTKPKSSKPSAPLSPTVIVYGLDPAGKPKAGRFPGKHANLARKAALVLKLAVCNVNRPKLIEIASKIPVGRLHAQGKAFLPFIKRELYDELATAVSPTARTANTKAGPKVTAEATRTSAKVYVILGFDERLKPRGARYLSRNEDQLVSAAAEMNLCLYEMRSADLISWVQPLPVGKLPLAGRGAVPEIRQALYSELVSWIAVEADAVPCGKVDGPLPAQKGPPESWETIGPGHLVVAQESQEHGWAEAVVVERKDDLLTLRYRDYPKVPRFYRHHRAVALLSPSATKL
ncbi:hypothetical protein H8B02_04285 [Bradyrhizobium sp. Pear77]|uniref:hypothetical protein n=1 Tax=Bradyrhizobium altum TaxID=1571202 RepID=UPI001E2D80C7|nr:hypothetical protein [Bradyrhizobium altum]MCC8952712.1 hypothetical protein [Bradyrhizobium altum]